MGQGQAQLGHFTDEQVRQQGACSVLWCVFQVILLAILEDQHNVGKELPIRGVFEGAELLPHAPKVHGFPHHLVVVRSLASDKHGHK